MEVSQGIRTYVTLCQTHLQFQDCVPLKLVHTNAMPLMRSEQQFQTQLLLTCVTIEVNKF